ncbi:uncharacterized protein LOC141700968 [Apium graveolens]|uniref:uncharacterized protein LOC141700968 n=1 Tax=Apium graveolens TaxID=4045 RepID=UPI003D7BDD0A
MKVFMQAHGIWEAIEPKDPKTTADEKMDKRALAIIYQGIADDMLLTIAEKKTSKEAWGEIKMLCLSADKVKKAKAQTLKSEFESLKMAFGETIDDEYVVKMLLRAAHEECLNGQTENSDEQQLLLTEDEWLKRESNDGKLLLTREEWLKRSGKDSQGSGGDYHVRDNRMVRNRSQVKCFNCATYSHFTNECRKPRKNRQQRGKANLAQVNDEEPALLMAMCDNVKKDVTVVIEGKTTNTIKERDNNIWYLDNGDINHMTGHREKFEKLDKTVKGEVKFGDDSLVKIEGKGEPVNSTHFKSIISGLRYLVHTRPHIAYSVGIVCSYMERPTQMHMNVVKRKCRYLKGTLQYGLVYMKGQGNYILSGFSDSDLAGRVDD